jgi:glycosyltransferase involved in cell wall biosynthesis
MTELRVLHILAHLTRDQGGLLSTLQGYCSALARAGAFSTVATVGDGEDLEHAEVLRFAPGTPHRMAASPRLKTWLLENAARFDAVLAHGLWLSPTRYAFAAARAARKPFFLRPAGMLDPDALAHHPLRKTIRWWLGERGMVRKAQLLFSTHEDLERCAGHLRLDRASCHVLPNCVGESWFGIARKPQHPPLLLCLNRLHPRKGVREWAQALSLLRQKSVSFQAVHAGAEEDPQYAAECRAAGVSAGVRWEGVVGAKRVHEHLAQAAVVAHPTVGYENFGMVIAEATAAGVPVVASRRALLTPQLERAGLVEACEPTALEIAAAMERAMRAAPDRIQRAREYTREHFSEGAVGSALAALLSQRDQIMRDVGQ